VCRTIAAYNLISPNAGGKRYIQNSDPDWYSIPISVNSIQRTAPLPYRKSRV